ncbi:PAS domain S-box protein [Synechococcus sp. RSCCF101]|nr:PAS domain S-box protein [Synechococcus sp. RSCCF101]
MTPLDEEGLREALDGLPLAVSVHEPLEGGRRFRILAFNRRAEAMEGLSHRQVLGRELQEVFPAAEAFGLLAVMRRVLGSGKAEAMPGAPYADERICGWREHEVHPLPSGRLMLISRDLDARAMTSVQREVRGSDQRYELLAEASLDGIWDWDLAGDRVFFSDRWKAQLGYQRHELEDSVATWKRLLHPDDRPRVQQ